MPVVALAYATYAAVPVATAHAYVPERPTVELVKLFSCDRYTTTADTCARYLETRAKEWLQVAQPGARITGRDLAANETGVFLAIFYEVPEWRTKQKPSAEKQ